MVCSRLMSETNPDAKRDSLSEIRVLEANHVNLAHEVRQGLAPRIDRLEEAASVMRGNIQEIKTKLEGVASRADLAGLETRLGSRLDSNINGLLQKALDAIPAQQAINVNRMVLMWTAVMALAAVVGLLWGKI